MGKDIIEDVMERRANKETLKSIGNSYGITRERVRQIEAKELQRRRKVQEGKKGNVCDWSVEALEASSRVTNCLRNSNIEKVHQILDYDAYDLLRIENFGIGSLKELRAILATHNLKIKGD